MQRVVRSLEITLWQSLYFDKTSAWFIKYDLFGAVFVINIYKQVAMYSEGWKFNKASRHFQI